MEVNVGSIVMLMIIISTWNGKLAVAALEMDVMVTSFEVRK
jgi:hypothetical protein